MNMKLLKHLGVMAAVLLGAGFESVQAQEGIVIPISDGGTITVDCNAAETIYFTDDNSGGQTFKILIQIRITPSRSAPANLAMRCR